jgi:hypothetical protein
METSLQISSTLPDGVGGCRVRPIMERRLTAQDETVADTIWNVPFEPNPVIAPGP